MPATKTAPPANDVRASNQSRHGRPMLQSFSFSLAWPPRYHDLAGHCVACFGAWRRPLDLLASDAVLAGVAACAIC